jgi:nucleotide-binding universal stress UspA family protein
MDGPREETMTLLMVLSDTLVESRQLLDYLNAMADTEARVVLLRVSPSGREASLEMSNRVLEQARHTLEFSGCDREIVTCLKIGDPEVIVPQIAVEEQADVILMPGFGPEEFPRLQELGQLPRATAEQVQVPVVISSPEGLEALLKRQRILTVPADELNAQ